MISAEEIKQRARELATPIDFDSLIKAGIMEKQGSWYKILKMDELPSYIEAKISSIRSSRGTTLVKFSAPSNRNSSL